MHDTSFVSLAGACDRQSKLQRRDTSRNSGQKSGQETRCAGRRCNTFALAPAVALPKSAVCDQEPVNARLAGPDANWLPSFIATPWTNKKLRCNTSWRQ